MGHEGAPDGRHARTHCCLLLVLYFIRASVHQCSNIAPPGPSSLALPCRLKAEDVTGEIHRPSALSFNVHHQCTEATEATGMGRLCVRPRLYSTKMAAPSQ